MQRGETKMERIDRCNLRRSSTERKQLKSYVRGNHISHSIAHSEHLEFVVYFPGLQTKKFVPLDGPNAPANYGQDKYGYPGWNIFNKYYQYAENVIPDDYGHNCGRPNHRVS